MATQYGIVMPSELFDSEAEALQYALEQLNDDEIPGGMYVVEVSKKTLLKVNHTDEMMEIWV